MFPYYIMATYEWLHMAHVTVKIIKWFFEQNESKYMFSFSFLKTKERFPLEIIHLLGNLQCIHKPHALEV